MTTTTADAASVGAGATNGVNTPTFCQVIDGNGEFGVSPSSLNGLFPPIDESSAKTNSAAPYGLVGIMGCQSSGKSTLLNHLFKTRFTAMDSRTGRQQTTTGVWMDADATVDPSLIIMDCEGTDSGERGEDRTTFERQTSLFALSLSNVLVLNMWEHDIGRYTASNYGILKTVLEVNLTLFSPSSPTVLLFIIRDHIEDDTPFAALKEKLNAELERVWTEVRKPPVYASKSASDMFRCRFAALPHYKLKNAEFKEAVVELRSRFVDPNNSEYLFKDIDMSSKCVPRDSFGKYVQSIWSTIRANKELNLPSQREMLASYRSDEMIQALLSRVNTSLQPIKDECSASLLPTFGATIGTCIQEALVEFDQNLAHYEQIIVANKRLELINKMCDVIEPYNTSQHKLLIDFVIEWFIRSANEKIKKAQTKDPIPDSFSSIMDSLKKEALELFHTKQAETKFVLSSELSLIIDTHLPTAFAEKSLTKRMEAHQQTERNRILSGIHSQIEEKLKQSTQNITNILRAADETMWTDLAASYDKTREQCDEYISSKSTAYNCSEKEQESYREFARIHLVSLYRLLCSQHVQLILIHMRRKFDRIFRYDSDGFLRKWKASDDIRVLFRECQNDALQLIPLFQRFQLLKHINGSKEESNGEDDILINNTRSAELKIEFPNEIEGALREAESEQSRLIESRRLPLWGLALIAFLGFDDFLALLRQPILLFFVLIIGAIVYILYSLRLLDQTIQIGLRFVQQLIAQVKPIIDPLIAHATTVISQSGIPISTSSEGIELQSKNSSASPNKSGATRKSSNDSIRQRNANRKISSE